MFFLLCSLHAITKALVIFVFARTKDLALIRLSNVFEISVLDPRAKLLRFRMPGLATHP
jgi:hypothetical protein